MGGGDLRPHEINSASGADNGGFCLINTSFQYNGSFRVTDEQAPTTSEGSELGGGGGGGRHSRLHNGLVDVCVRACV